MMTRKMMLFNKNRQPFSIFLCKRYKNTGFRGAHVPTIRNSVVRNPYKNEPDRGEKNRKIAFKNGRVYAFENGAFILRNINAPFLNASDDTDRCASEVVIFGVKS